MLSFKIGEAEGGVKRGVMNLISKMPNRDRRKAMRTDCMVILPGKVPWMLLYLFVVTKVRWQCQLQRRTWNIIILLYQLILESFC